MEGKANKNEIMQYQQNLINDLSRRTGVDEINVSKVLEELGLNVILTKASEIGIDVRAIKTDQIKARIRTGDTKVPIVE